MALDGDENHADQARYKAMCLTAFRSDAFGRVRSDGLSSGDGLIFPLCPNDYPNSHHIPYNVGPPS